MPPHYDLLVIDLDGTLLSPDGSISSGNAEAVMRARETGLPVMIAATFLYLFITQDKKITKWEGWLLIIFYVFFAG